MEKKKAFLLSTVAITLALAGCGGKGNNNGGGNSAAVDTKNPASIEHEGTPISGGTLKFAISSSSPIKGIFIDELADSDTDFSVIGFIDNEIFDFDNEHRFTNKGMASLELNQDEKTAKVTLNSKDYKWSDGEPVTIDDYIFAYEGISHKDYTGTRFNENMKNVVGADEFHDGVAETISGIEKLDDYTVKVHYKEISPSMQYGGGAISGYIMPKHIFKNIPVADWEKSDYVRGTKHVGLGPFKIKSMIAGESVTVERNEYYFKGKTKLDGAVLEVVSPESLVSEMKAGRYDIASMPNSKYTTYADANNFTLLSNLSRSYSYISFKLGKFDKDSGKNVMDPNAKMSNPKLRQAIAYAIDNDTVAKELYNGLSHRSASPIIPFYRSFYDSSFEGFKYDPEKAKSLLDEAGYKDVNGDGLREDPKGNKLTISFASFTSDETALAKFSQYIEWWKAVGLDVQWYTGRALEVNSFYEKLETDDPGIDMFAAGWNVSYNPDPSDLYGEYSANNFSRFATEEHNKILEKIGSKEGFDLEKQKGFMKEWQQYAFDQAFVIPCLTGDDITAVNKRVKYYGTEIEDVKSELQNLEVTAAEPVKGN